MIEFFPSRKVAISIFSFNIHWYGLLYLLAFWIAYALLPKLAKYRNIHLTHDDWASVLTWSILGVIVGGRLGYVVLYEPQYFLRNPLEIFAVWNGGMSSHGGFLGVCAFLSYVLWQRTISVRDLADIAVIPAAIGLALGRLGNFINQELYGTITALPWGMHFPGAEGLRHPLQLYGVVKDLSIAALCFWYLRKVPYVPGRTFALFLMLYGSLRFLLEFIREQTYPLVNFGVISLTRGQLYTLPLFSIGVFLWWRWGRASASA